MLGFSANVSTFMPKNPTVNVRGRKMNVIHDRRQRDVFNSKDCLESLISTDLYIYAIVSACRFFILV